MPGARTRPLNSVERSIFNSHQRTLHAGDSAREWFKARNPILSRKIQIALDDELEEILEHSEPSEFTVNAFDCRAKAYLECVERQDVESYDHYLAILNANRLRLAKAACGASAGTPIVLNGSDIDNKLAERLKYWRKEAYSRLVPDDPTPEPPASRSSSSTVQRRAVLLDEYKQATGNPADHKIYTADNVPIHKPEFYEWKNGTLSDDSATTINFERFMSEKKPPL
jgi:hypothetical protein